MSQDYVLLRDKTREERKRFKTLVLFYSELKKYSYKNEYSA